MNAATARLSGNEMMEPVCCQAECSLHRNQLGKKKTGGIKPQVIEDCGPASLISSDMHKDPQAY